MKVEILDSFPFEGDYIYFSYKEPIIGIYLTEENGFKMPAIEDTTVPLCQYCGGVSKRKI